MARLTIQNLTKKFVKNAAVDRVSLEIPDGAFAGILGPSGCGKTTLLRLIAGLEQPTQGDILIGDRNITMLPPEKRELGMMFQSYALFPHMSVRDNLRFPLKARKIGTSQEQNDKIKQVLALVQLEEKIDRLPRQLSGGEQQRVALARAIIAEPSVLLLDEPLSNLDAKLRAGMQIELIELHRKLGLTTIFVTHDQEEALALSDVIVLMLEGRVKQIGTPEKIYSNPKTPFAADFLGSANLIPVTVVHSQDDQWQAILPNGPKIRVPAPGTEKTGEYLLMLRQEDLKLTDNARKFDAAVPVKVLAQVYLGAKIRFVVGLGDQRLNILMTKAEAVFASKATHLAWRVNDASLLPMG
jgi:ABC-type Fe3+/spermidine/putrescine transport system ATPase subunit